MGPLEAGHSPLTKGDGGVQWSSDLREWGVYFLGIVHLFEWEDIHQFHSSGPLILREQGFPLTRKLGIIFQGMVHCYEGGTGCYFHWIDQLSRRKLRVLLP